MTTPRLILTAAAALIAAVSADSQLVIHSRTTVAGEPVAADSSEVIPTITVVQPRALEERIYRHRHNGEGEYTGETPEQEPAESGEVSRQGFRVQVFSDNNQRTSQKEAREKERLLNERFPEYETYIVYNSPYWRLKVGDFRTEFDAETAADEIKRAFPQFAREVRIVRDRINTNRQ